MEEGETFRQPVVETATMIQRGGWLGLERRPEIQDKINKLDHNQVNLLISQLGLREIVQMAERGKYNPQLIERLPSPIRPVVRPILRRYQETWKYNPNDKTASARVKRFWKVLEDNPFC